MVKAEFDVAIFVLKSGGVWEDKFRLEGFRILNADQNCTGRGALHKQLVKYAKKRNGKGLLKAVLKEKFDLVVSYMMWEQLATGFVSGVPAVCWFHWDVESNKAFRWIVNENRKLMMKYDQICCVSKAGQESLESLIRRPVELHYNPIDSQRIRDMAEDCTKLPDTPYICAVGRMVPKKGFVRLVHVHKRLLEADALHKLVIVGDGPERDSIENAIKETKTEDSVILVGYQSNPYPYIKNSRFLVCSSFTEALPVISMEALSLGVPIVSAIPSIEEVFGDENCGIITNNDDDSLFAGMFAMLTDECCYAKAKQGAELLANFSEHCRKVSLISLLGKLFSKKTFDDLRIPEGYIEEDSMSLPHILERSKRIARSEEKLYHWRITPGSVTRSGLTEKSFAHIEVRRYQAEFFCGKRQQSGRSFPKGVPDEGTALLLQGAG